MTRRFGPMLVLVTLVLLSLASMGATLAPTKTPASLTVHEWGTFTSVAGPDGRAVQWTPLDGPEDLPCFVERYDPRIKGSLPGTVRMETPVLYFYTPEETTVDVDVRFNGGAITEWYPSAAVAPRTILYGMVDRPGFSSRATWNHVRIVPGASADFPTEAPPSHYYLARGTDAAPVQLSAQREKFLFYRGLGTFQPPISATIGADGAIVVKSPRSEPLGDLILFENRGGKMAYRVQPVTGTEATLSAPVLGNGTTPPTAELEKILIARGLFPREAKAMVDTWRDSWFEEGARLLYLPSRAAIDAILPLQITPQPSATARAFVGRVELITPRTEQDVMRALDANDGVALASYGRFLRPIVAQLVAKDRQQAPLATLMPNEETALQARAFRTVERVRMAQWKARPRCPQPLIESRTTQLHWR
jgi:hypothetical protein